MQITLLHDLKKSFLELEIVLIKYILIGAISIVILTLA